MEARIRVSGGDEVTETAELWGWLRGERGLAGTVAAVRKPPADGELGGVVDTLAVTRSPTNQTESGCLETTRSLRGAVNDILQTALNDGTWMRIYNSTLGSSGPPTRMPAIDRY